MPKASEVASVGMVLPHNRRRLLFANWDRRLDQLGYLAAHPRRHLAYLACLRAARRKGLASGEPLLSLKYLGGYLGGFLDREQRRRIIMAHYGFLCRLFDRADQGAAWTGGLLLWRREAAGDGVGLSLTLSRSSHFPLEGESELRLLMNGLTLYRITFVISPGWSVGLQVPHVLLVGGLQGVPGTRDGIRAAAKANGEIAPHAMLLIAAQALADTLALPYVVGITSELQTANADAGQPVPTARVELWVESGAERLASGFLLLRSDRSVGEERPIQGSHRNRGRRKRLLKQRIAEELRVALRRGLGL